MSTQTNAQAPVDVRKNLRMVLQHVLICGPDKTIEQAIREIDDAVAELIDLQEWLTAALDNVLLHHGDKMPLADLQSRAALVDECYSLLARVSGGES